MCAIFGPSMLFQVPHGHQIAGAEIPNLDLGGIQDLMRGGGGCLDNHLYYLIVIVV